MEEEERIALLDRRKYVNRRLSTSNGFVARTQEVGPGSLAMRLRGCQVETKPIKRLRPNWLNA